MPSSSSSQQENDEAWYRCSHRGQSLCFRLRRDETDDVVHPMTFLDGVVHALQRHADMEVGVDEVADAALRTAAQRVYAGVRVEVDVTQSTTTAGSEAEETSWVEDWWSPWYLALCTGHEEALGWLLRFHAEWASAVVELLLRHATGSVRGVVYRSWGGTLVLLRRGLGTGEGATARVDTEHTDGDEVNNDDDDDPTALTLSSVLNALEPWVRCVLEERDLPTADRRAQRVLRRAFALREEQGERSAVPTLYVCADTLYTCCHAALDVLETVLQDCHDTLTPVLHGRGVAHGSSGTVTRQGSEARPRSGSRHSTPVYSASHSRTASNTPGRVGRVETTTTREAWARLSLPAAGAEPFWVRAASQDAQRVAFYATWIDHRDRVQEGAARLRLTRRVMQECHGSLQLLKHACDAHAVPPRCVWSGVVLLCGKLFAASCTVEDFVDGMGTDHVAYWTLPLHDGALPGAMTLLTAAGAMAVALLERPCYDATNAAARLRLLGCKVATILAAERGGGGVGSVTPSTATTATAVTRTTSALQEYLLHAPAHHAARFTDLWLGLYHSSSDGAVVRKYDTRAEMLFDAVLDRVVVAAQTRWDRLNAERDAVAVAELLTALRAWVRVWARFFRGLRELAASPRTHTCCTDDSNDDGSVHEFVPSSREPAELFDALLTRLHTRLRDGCAALRVMDDDLVDAAPQSTTRTAESDEGSMSSLDARFDAARAGFGAVAGSQGNEVKLRFYALYKQATEGDVAGAQPWRIDVVAHAKWSAWSKTKGMSREDAKRAYVAAYEALQKGTPSM